MLTEKFFDSDGIRLHYIDYGGQGPPLVLLAGLGGSAHIYRSLAPRLTPRYRVIALTRRGHGRSERPESGYELDTLVDDILRFLDELQIERAGFVGHSFAGIEIPRLAIRYPDRVAAIVYMDALHVLLEPTPDSTNDTALNALERTPNPNDLISSDVYMEYVKRSRPDLASIWCHAIEANRLEDLIMDGDRVVIDGHAAKISAQVFGSLGTHRDPAYGEVAAPALAIVLGGTTNPYLVPGASAELVRSANTYYVEEFRPWLERRLDLFREAAPGARIVELDTSNHMLFVAKEDETVEAISAFLV